MVLTYSSKDILRSLSLSLSIFIYIYICIYSSALCGTLQGHLRRRGPKGGSDAWPSRGFRMKRTAPSNTGDEEPLGREPAFTGDEEPLHRLRLSVPTKRKLAGSTGI